MPNNQQIRARAGATPIAKTKSSVSANADLIVIAQQMYGLMMRNVTSAGYVINDSSGTPSKPGCVIASPSYPLNTPGVDQDYVFNWVRDAAITAFEIVHAGGSQTLSDYVNFALLCRQNAPTLGHACFKVDGTSRLWSEQNDGPALQISALIQAYPQLSNATQKIARTLITDNLSYLLTSYTKSTYSLWEEEQGFSFFARSVQLRCFREIAVNTLNIPVPPQVSTAIAWLSNALSGHWNGTCYVSVLSSDQQPPQSVVPGYDPNIDVVSAAIYGAIGVTDPKLLATAALLRRQWSDQASQVYYPINGADAARGLGPLLGRYPSDTYDGDVQNPQPGGHPWALCTCNLAELYYRVAGAIDAGANVAFGDPTSRDFFSQINITPNTSNADASIALRDAGDRMLRSVIFHSNQLALSEQFDAVTGYEKSVSNLTWSYAAFLSAVRAR